jgi:hypothetical protein
VCWGCSVVPMGLRRAGVMRDGMACLGISPAAPHGKVVLHFKLIKDLFEMVGNVESMVG